MSGLEILSWIAVGLSLVGVILNNKQDKRCFIVWLVANSFWFYINIEAEIYAQAVLFVIYNTLSVIGWISWRKKEKELEKLKLAQDQ